MKIIFGIETLNIENALYKVREEILRYESGEKKPKHIGQRMFGYLVNADYFSGVYDKIPENINKSLQRLYFCDDIK